MAENTKPHSITIDLNQFKLHIELKNRIELTLHFNSPSRRFYLSVIAFVVNEMKRLGKITSIPLEGHHDLLALLNETIGGSAGSSEIEPLLSRIYMKWQHALPNLEEAPLFMVLGKKKGYEEGIGKTYSLTEVEKDSWANLFEYKGSHENVRLRFAIDKIGATLNDIVIVFEDSLNGDAWERFISSLKEKEGEEQKVEPDSRVSEEPEVPAPQLERRRIVLLSRYRWPALIGAIIVVVGAAAVAIWGLYIHDTPQPERTPPEKTPKEEVASLQHEKPLGVVPPSIEAPDREKMIVDVAPKKMEELPSAEKVSKPVAPPPPKEEVASKEKMAFPLPEVPSIAVLPFINMSDDPKQEFFSDGITENIITALSKIPRLFVISRQSTFSYKGKPVKVKQVSEELGVRYVLEGSIQRSADRIRINTQLIDALIGSHIWAERYDRDLKDIFTLQDEITMKILVATQVKLTEGEQVSGVEKYYRGKQGLDCYLKLTEANGIRMRWNIEANNLARRMIEEAIAMCPENPMGYIALGWIYHYDYILGNTKSPRETIEKGIELVQKAIAMDDSIAGAHIILCYFYIDKGDNDKAIAEAERAMALNPGDWSALNTYANSLTFAGRPEEAIPFYQKAIRLTPFGASVLYRDFGHALRDTSQFEEAVSAYKKAIQLSPNDITAHIGLAVTYSYMGREEEARAEAAEVLRINPKFSLDSYAKRIPLSIDKSARDKHINALRKAGLK